MKAVSLESGKTTRNFREYLESCNEIDFYPTVVQANSDQNSIRTQEHLDERALTYRNQTWETVELASS